MSLSVLGKRKFDEFEQLNQFGCKTFLEVFLGCRDLWHYMLKWLEDDEKFKVALTSKQWKDASKGADLYGMYYNCEAFRSLAACKYFVCRKAAVYNWKTLVLCPASVTDLHFDVLEDGNDASFDVARFFPNIKAFSIGSNASVIRSGLPTTLERLELCRSRSAIVYPRALPPSLRYLSMYRCEPGKLPENLTYLKCYYQCKLYKSALPATLRTLDLTIDTWDQIQRHTFPKSLENIIVYCKTNSGPMTPACFEDSSNVKQITYRTSVKWPDEGVVPRKCRTVINRFSTTYLPNQCVRVVKQSLRDIEYVTDDWKEKHTNFEELHDLDEHEVPEFKYIGVLPSSLKAVYFGGVPFDPVSKKPIPRVDLGEPEPIVVYEKQRSWHS